MAKYGFVCYFVIEAERICACFVCSCEFQFDILVRPNIGFGIEFVSFSHPTFFHSIFDSFDRYRSALFVHLINVVELTMLLLKIENIGFFLHFFRKNTSLPNHINFMERLFSYIFNYNCNNFQVMEYDWNTKEGKGESGSVDLRHFVYYVVLCINTSTVMCLWMFVFIIVKS